jgi:hypothetical protein
LTLEHPTTLVQGVNQYQRLLAQYRPTQTDFEQRSTSGADHVIVRAVFDHDWEQHLLVQQCSTGVAAQLMGLDEWAYALYYVSGDEIIHVRTFFDAPACPFTEAAQMVETWQTEGHYGGDSNSIESDMFD